MERTIEMVGFQDGVSKSEALSLSEVWKAYATDCPCEEIMQVCFNAAYGNTYIALENGIQIVCSSFCNGVNYVVTNNETDEDFECETYKEAAEKQQEAQEAADEEE